MLSAEMTYAQSASMSSGLSMPPQGGIWFLPRDSEMMKRKRNLRLRAVAMGQSNQALAMLKLQRREPL